MGGLEGSSARLGCGTDRGGWVGDEAVVFGVWDLGIGDGGLGWSGDGWICDCF